MKRTLIIAGAVIAGTVLTATPAHADEVTCRGNLGAVTVDDLRVVAGATCRLDGTTIEGTLTIEDAGRLQATDIHVNGDIQGEGHRSVNVVSSTVGGSVQLVQGGSAVLRSNRVTGDVQSFANDGDQRFNRNRIDGNLQCKGNAPAPTGARNIVDGNKEDQCASL